MLVTELEGAVLSEIHHRDNHSAFKVRRAFQISPSTEWSGSAGAVYPAIRRLTARGFVRAELLPTARRASRLSLTPEGVRALEDWAMDVQRAIGVGLDPFRLRSGIWASFPLEQRRECLMRMLDAVAREVQAVDARLTALDAIERPRAEWAAMLQSARHRWLSGELRQLAKEAMSSVRPDGTHNA